MNAAMQQVLHTTATLPRHAGCALVIGNFDGVHPGHRALIGRARETGLPVAALSFEPHPREYFAGLKGEASSFRLTLAPAKTALLQAAGSDHVVLMAFDEKLASLPAEDFIEQVIVRGLGAAHVLVGDDFAFGHRRGGDVALLAAAGRAAGFAVTPVPQACDAAGAAYSSSRARDDLARGDFAALRQSLGRDWSVAGPVIGGDRRGRTLDMPTANQALDRLALPPYGIYAVRATLDGHAAPLDGVASLGVRPMFALPRPLLETHLFGFDGDIYGKNMVVTPVAFLRPEQRFDSLEALKTQMKQDCLDAGAVLKSGSL